MLDKTLKLTHSDGSFSYLDEFRLHNEGLNYFKGWDCAIKSNNYHLGFRNLSTGFCKQKIRLGDILEDVHSIDFTNQTIVCKQDRCFCYADFHTIKINPNKEPFTKLEPTSNELFFSWSPFFKCNFSCDYCSPSSHNGDMPDKELLEKIFDKLCLLIGKRKITFTFIGGEATLSRSLIEWVKRLKQMNSDNNVIVLTNGSRSLSYLSKLAEHAQLDFSVHLHQEKLLHLAAKINKLSKLPGIVPPKVQILFPATETKNLKLFISNLTNINYHTRVTLLKIHRPDFRPEQYDYTDYHHSLVDKLNSYFATIK
tara:strand:- start:720 stop:1652 length:933 start_codon:yes stop_codon:yes gene_type:complete